MKHIFIYFIIFRKHNNLINYGKDDEAGALLPFLSKDNDYGYIPPGGCYRFQGNIKSAMSALVGPCVCKTNNQPANTQVISSLTMASNMFGLYLLFIF